MEPLQKEQIIQLFDPAATDAPQTFNVKLPDGTTINGIPVGTTKDEIRAKFEPKGFKFDAPAPKLTDAIPQKPDPTAGEYAEDIAKSAAYRGIPEGVAGATPLGIGLNIVRGVSDATRWAGHKISDAITGEKLPYANENPIPSSSDVLKNVVQTVSGKPLYEPKTTPGAYASAIAAGAAGGKISGIPLVTSVPASVASEAAGQATQGTDWEIPARIVGAVAGAAGANGLRDKFTQKPAPVTQADIKAVANAKYAEVEKTGHEIPKEVTNGYIDDVKSTLLSSDDLINSMKSSQPLRDAFDDIALFKDQPMTLSRAQALDEQISNMVDSHTTLGQVNKVGKKLLEAQHKLRQVVDENFDTPALREARQAWAAQAKLRDVERIMQRAETMENPATSIKAGFRQLLTNPNKSKWFTKDELKIIEQGATTSAPAEVLRTLGSRLIPIITAGAGGGLAGTAIATAGSMAARGGATKMQVNRAMKLSDKISEPYKKVPPTSSNAALADNLSKKRLGMGRLDDKIERPAATAAKPAPEPQNPPSTPETNLAPDRNSVARPQTPEESVPTRGARNIAPEQQRRPGSWVIVDKATGKAVFETFKEKTANAINTEKYQAIPALEYLSKHNAAIRDADRLPKPPGDTKGRPRITIHPKK